MRGQDGRVGLAERFQGRRQVLVVAERRLPRQPRNDRLANPLVIGLDLVLQPFAAGADQVGGPQDAKGLVAAGRKIGGLAGLRQSQWMTGNRHDVQKPSCRLRQAPHAGPKDLIQAGRLGRERSIGKVGLGLLMPDQGLHEVGLPPDSRAMASPKVSVPGVSVLISAQARSRASSWVRGSSPISQTSMYRLVAAWRSPMACKTGLVVLSSAR